MSTNGFANGINEKHGIGHGDLVDVQLPDNKPHDALNPIPPATAQVAPKPPVIVQPTPMKANGTAPSKDVEAGKRSPSPGPKIEAGRQPDSVYAESLAPWRDNFRKWCVRRLGPESEKIAALQAKVRTPARDSFFFYSAIFGSKSRPSAAAGCFVHDRQLLSGRPS